MRKLKLPIPIVLAALVAPLQLARAQEFQIEFNTYSSLSKETGVQADIKVIYPDDSIQEFRTNENGYRNAKLKMCDANVKIEARSIWGTHTMARKNCDPVPVELEMTPTIQAGLVESVLRRISQENQESYPITSRNYFVEFQQAVESANVSKAAESANNLQWSLLNEGRSISAYEFGVFAQAAGFASFANIENSSINSIGQIENSLMVVDYQRDLIVMSNNGKSYLEKAQNELGIFPSGSWDAQTFRSLSDAEALREQRM
ncbi:hypothetical protein GCM10008927_17300 [Amylibacter ulvae]|uniref:Uncharacterized protein n=1 Tax=Paramylibacter ulvae TaxID=1651968 RepID=A0ABQ3D4C4_9RHOB|nr:hypothetical protein [Amylibacter ulvae]GHA52408.1 hypothetical protein GCM10008927_17300 [Amylibacter ulvae]